MLSLSEISMLVQSRPVRSTYEVMWFAIRYDNLPCHLHSSYSTSDMRVGYSNTKQHDYSFICWKFFFSFVNTIIGCYWLLSIDQSTIILLSERIQTTRIKVNNHMLSSITKREGRCFSGKLRSDEFYAANSSEMKTNFILVTLLSGVC